MFPWMFEEIHALKPFRHAAEALHRMPLEGRLYDAARLAANEVPVAAAVYFDDMYVDAGLSLQTAGRVGNLKPWVTNEYEHGRIASGSSCSGAPDGDGVWHRIKQKRGSPTPAPIRLLLSRLAL